MRKAMAMTSFKLRWPPQGANKKPPKEMVGAEIGRHDTDSPSRAFEAAMGALSPHCPCPLILVPRRLFLENPVDQADGDGAFAYR
jgi:hypothetical protein